MRQFTVNCRTFISPWGNEDTQTLIDILAQYDVKTTFFVVGDWAEKYPESVKALHDAGHEVMSHSNHHDHYNSLSTQQIIDDVTASIEGVLNRMYYDNVTDMRDDAVQMSDMVVRATESICELVNELPRFRHSKTLRELVFAINTIETDADHLFIESMRTLHTTCTDPLQVFAWHDVYRHLEQCSDDCERVANTIDSIVMKNS